MSSTIFISLIHNAALLLSLGLIYDVVYRGRRESPPMLHRITAGLIIGVVTIVLMSTPAQWKPGIIFDTRTILLGLTGLYFGAVSSLLAMAIAGAYRLNLGGGGALMGVATIVSSSLIGLAWRHYRLRGSRELSLSELYLFGGIVHAVMILCMFLLPQDVIVKTISTLALPVIIIYPIGTALLGNLLSGRQRRHRIEEELQDSIQRFNQLAEHSLTVTWEINTAGLYTYVSPAAESVFGYRPDELIGTMHFYELHPEEGREEFKDTIFTIIRSAVEFQNLVNPVRTKQGTVIWVSTNGLPVLDQEGALTGYRGADKNITEQKLAEEALAASEGKYRDLLESVRLLAVILDIKGNITFCNNYLLNLTGWRGEEILQRSWFDLFLPEELRESVSTIFLSGIADGTLPLHSENPIVTKEGSSRLIEWNNSILRDTGGTPIGVACIGADITEHRNLETQLQHSQKMESIGTLAGGVAHDFNNMLTAIIGYGYMTLMKMPKDDPNRPGIEQILEVSDRASHLTKDLLLFSRKQLLDRRPLDLNQSILKLEKFLVRVIGEDITFKTFLSSGNLPILGDEHQISQVLMNLATNARDAMPRGGTFTITTEQVHLDTALSFHYGLRLSGRYALISVSDTGHGMDESTKQHIFEPFYTTKEVGKGTGLGLAVAYGIVKQHEGHITVSSTAGSGTNFNMYLPIIATGTADEKETVAAEQPVGGSETILLAEDNETVRILTESVLREFGYTVISAVDGDDAIVKYQENKHRIQMLLFDLVMPKKNGKEAYDEIRKISPEIKAIFASGYSPDIVRDRASLGDDAVIVFKPITPLELLKKVRSMLDKGKL